MLSFFIILTKYGKSYNDIFYKKFLNFQKNLLNNIDKG